MSRFVDKLSFFERSSNMMEEGDELGRSGLLYGHHAGRQGSHTLGQLLKHVGDASDHQVLEFGEDSPEPGRSIPFVLAFSDLSYSVKTSKKLSFFRRGRGGLSNTKTLLDSISGWSDILSWRSILSSSEFYSDEFSEN